MSQKGFSSGQGYRPEQVVMLQLMQNDTSEGAADSVKPHYSNALKVAAMLSIATCGYDHYIMLSWLASASKQASSPRASIRHTVPGRSDARDNVQLWSPCERSSKLTHAHKPERAEFSADTFG